jgi:alkylation response protein AidB-like acyl-CoA dehydrogenase
MDMDFLLPAGHLARRDEFRAFAGKELAPAADGFARENIRKLARRGYMGLPIPAEWGGLGEDFLTYILLIEEISRVCASTGVILAVHTSVGSFPLFYFGTTAQKRRYLDRLARGSLLGAFALTEADAGSDAAALRMSARRAPGGGYILNGTKLFITSGGEADLYTVFALTDPSKGSKGVTAFLVDKETPGLEIGPPERKMGLHGSVTTELRFSDALVPEENRLGAEGEGFAIAMSLLDGGRIGIAAQGLGLARAALEDTIAHLGAAPGQGAAFTLASLHTRLEAARLLVYRAALLKEAGVSCTREASMAKLFATDLAVDAATRCLDLWKLAGAAADNPVARYFCDAKVTQIYEGSNQIQRLIIARELLSHTITKS